MNAVRNIILNLMPKYVFESSVVSLNFVSIKNCTKYTIDIEYEYNFINLSSSKRDEDATSEFDGPKGSTSRDVVTQHRPLSCCSIVCKLA